MKVESRLEALGLTLPAPAALPPATEIPFAWVRVHRDRAFISGHGPLNPDGSPAGPFGKVPSEVTLKSAMHAARLATLAMLASLRTALGDLDRVTAWLTIDGHINAEPGYAQTTTVINPVSELIVQLYGAEAGRHARTAIGAPALPLNLPVGDAEVDIAVDGIAERLFLLGFHQARPAELSEGTGMTIHLHATDAPGEWSLDTERRAYVVEHLKGDVALRGPSWSLNRWFWRRGSTTDDTDDLFLPDVEAFGDVPAAEEWRPSF